MRTTIALLTFSIIVLSSCQQEPGTWLTLTNPTEDMRSEIVIRIDLDSINSWIEIPMGHVPLILDKSGYPLPCQIADCNLDGEMDHLLVLTDLKSGETKSIKLISRDPENFPEFNSLTNVRLGANSEGYPELPEAERLDGVTYENHGLTGEAFQMEGPAWENDRVGFRNYLDQRNGIDIFGKLVSEMVLDSVGIEGRGSYHEPADWGMDILKVGTSLGAGAIGYYFNDSIFRVGDNGMGMYRLDSEGALYSALQFSYSDWSMGGTQLNVTQNITIEAGTYFFTARVLYSGIEENIDLVTGIVNMKSDTLYTADLNEQYMGFYTHDLQSEDTTYLGMAVMVHKDDLSGWGKTRDAGDGIIQTYFVSIGARPLEYSGYRFYSFWEMEDPKWADRNEIEEKLRSDARLLVNPVTVKPF